MDSPFENPGYRSDMSYPCMFITMTILLQNLCRRLIGPTKSLHQHLLRDPPAHFRNRLTVLQEKCSRVGNSHVDLELLHDFKNVLKRSIVHYRSHD